jgi:hypothetical protein
MGAFSRGTPASDRDSNLVLAQGGSEETGVPGTDTPQVLADAPPGVQIVAVRPSWVRVRAADGSVIYEAIMNAGDTYQVPQTEEPATLRTGESGALYLAINGRHYGPVGPNGAVTSKLPLAVASLTETYTVADIAQDNDLERYVAELTAVPAAETAE